MNIFLFHRDLRIQDNTALIYQLQQHDSITPIFIFPPEQIDPTKNSYFSNSSVQFMCECLHELSETISKKDGKIYFFKGDNLSVIKSIHLDVEINSISYNIDYTPYARQRDNEIKNWCLKNNISCYEKEDYAMYDITEGYTNKKDNTPYLVFTPFKNNCMKNLHVREINSFKKFKFTKSNKLVQNKYCINEKEIDNFYSFDENIEITGGRKNGLKILKNLNQFKEYDKLRNMFFYETTKLSAYNHFTPISIREVYYAVENKLGKAHGIISELHWRDFYLNICWNFGHILQGQIKGKNKSFKQDYDKIKWSYNKSLFKKWCNGTTGFPLIDACMRQLNHSGFMHNRGRMCVASFLTKTLHIDWRLGEQYFATKLTDYDATMNNSGWQWTAGSGTDAQPYFRIFNIWTQAENYDPECIYIKQWLPELEDITNKEILNWYDPEIHNKYIKEGIKYYKPIVEHNKERLETLKIYKKALK